MRRKLSVLLAVLMLLSAVTAFGAKPIEAAEKAQKTRAIAIVYDNSGSMYWDGMNRGGGKWWCQALYAMEVFASMMNEGDSIWIYPMWPVTAQGQSYPQGSPIQITNPKDAPIIRDIETPQAGNTPIQSIEWAYEGLKSMTGDEKWLVVLTDGANFNAPDGPAYGEGDPTRQALEELIQPYVNDVNVLYLGIGDEASKPNISPGSQFQGMADKAVRSEEILSKLTSMCNMIFGRDELQTSGGTVEFDVSMARLIVFVQGDNVSNVDLAGAGTRGDDLSPRYSEHKSTRDSQGSFDGGIDDTLQGVITNFYDAPAGSYTLSYSGSVTSTGVYYEPDVDLVARLVDANGNDVTNNPELSPGEYTIEYGLVDGQTGEMTSSDLLGNTHYDVNYTLNGETFSLSTDEKQGTIPVSFGEEDTFKLDDITVEYLSGYRIHKSGDELGWPSGGVTIPKQGPDPAGELAITVSGGTDHYNLSTLEEEEPYTLEFTYDGNKMSADQVATIELDIQSQNAGIAFEPVLDGDHYTVTVHYADEAHPENTECGDVVALIKASYTEPEHETATANAAINFTLDNDVTGLGAKLEMEHERYTLAELDGSQAILNLTMGGEPLTDQQMADLNVEVTVADKKGHTIPYTVEKDPAGSRAIITFSKENVKTGNYKIDVTATTKDQIGMDSSASASAKFHVRRFPLWLIFTGIFVILALLAALAWFILSRKVLPKRVFVRNTIYSVDGEEVPGDPQVNFKGARQKTGTIQITVPRSAAHPMARAHFTLHVEAADTRFKVLKKALTGKGSLTAICTGIDSHLNVKRVMVSGTAVNWDEETHRQILPPGEDHLAPFRIGTDDSASMNAEAMDENGYVDMNMTTNFNFR